MGPSVEIMTDSELDEALTITEADVDALKEIGYKLVGGVRSTSRGLRSKAVVMLGPERDRVASVALTLLEPVIGITSASNQELVLLSRNGSFWQEPPWVLCNDLPAVTPRELDKAHRRALEQVQAVFDPRIRDGDETIEDLARDVARHLSWLADFRSVYGPTSGFGMLGPDSRSRKRVKRWARARPPSVD